MTKTKHINAKKHRTASEKAGFRCLKTTSAGGDAVKALAKVLYSEYKEEHNAAGIYGGSATARTGGTEEYTQARTVSTSPR